MLRWPQLVALSLIQFAGYSSLRDIVSNLSPKRPSSVKLQFGSDSGELLPSLVTVADDKVLYVATGCTPALPAENIVVMDSLYARLNVLNDMEYFLSFGKSAVPLIVLLRGAISARLTVWPAARLFHYLF